MNTARRRRRFARSVPAKDDVFLDTLIAADPKAKIMEDVTRLMIAGEENSMAPTMRACDLCSPKRPSTCSCKKAVQPLMRRLMLKTTDNGTLIQFDLTDWKIDPKFEGDPFAFTPPPDAKKVAPESGPRSP